MMQIIQPGSDTRLIQGNPDLERSHALRYQVYCEERGFLPASEYPSAREFDEFDDYSLHVASFDDSGQMAGTVRLVLPGPLGLPMFHYCRIEPEWRRKLDEIARFCEISRLAVSRSYRRGPSRGFAGKEILHRPELATSDVAALSRDKQHRSIVISLFEAMHRAARRRGITHAVMAMEPSLRRLLGRFRIPLQEIGQECDYYGLVTPYILDLDAFDRNVPPNLFGKFANGPEPEYLAPMLN
jgi:N-acyl amino acid synthase of PEP-CTERM/exosortase system